MWGAQQTECSNIIAILTLRKRRLKSLEWYLLARYKEKPWGSEGLSSDRNSTSVREWDVKLSMSKREHGFQ